jgi:predicted CoA-binding protein
VIDDDIRFILRELRTWAVVGCSPDSSRDSHRIASLLHARGYRVIPVNPEASTVLGRHSYAELPLDEGIEVVDLFRRSSAVSRHVDEAIAIGAKAVWMQLGVIDHDAASRAREAGLRVVVNRCPAIELPRLDALEGR